jgi:hypothetical protein
MAAGEFRSDVSPSLVRDMIYGAVEHRTWAFLRNEGDFNIDETADGITELIYCGLAKRTVVQDSFEQTATRLEKAVAKLEGMAEKGVVVGG